MKRIAAAFLLGLSTMAAGQPSSGPATAPAPSTSEAAAGQSRMMVEAMSARMLQAVDPVLAHPGVPEADKEKLRELRKQYVAATAKLIEELNEPMDPMMAYAKAEKLPDVVTYIQNRPDLYAVSLRGNMIAMGEAGLVQSAVMAKDDSNAYFTMLDTVTMDSARRKNAKAAIEKILPEVKGLFQVTMDSKADMNSRMCAGRQMNDRILATIKDVRASLSAEENQDLDWQFLKRMNQPAAANVLVFSTFITPARAPEDGKYTLKVGDMKTPGKSVTSVTLKKGETMGFRSVDKILKAYAGDKEFALPDPAPPFALWMLDAGTP